MDDPTNLCDLGRKAMAFTVLVICDLVWWIMLFMNILNFPMNVVNLAIIPHVMLLILMGLLFYKKYFPGMVFLCGYKLFNLLGNFLLNVYMTFEDKYKIDVFDHVLFGISMICMLMSTVFVSKTCLKECKNQCFQKQGCPDRAVAIESNREGLREDQQQPPEQNQQRHVHFPNNPTSHVLEFVHPSDYIYVAGISVENPMNQMNLSPLIRRHTVRYTKHTARKYRGLKKNYAGWESNCDENNHKIESREGESTSNNLKKLGTVPEEISVHVEDECAANDFCATSAENPTNGELEKNNAVSDSINQRAQQDVSDEEKDDESFDYFDNSTDSEADTNSSSLNENI